MNIIIHTHTHTRPSRTESNMHSTSLLPYLFTTTSLHLSIYIPPFPSLHLRIDCRLSLTTWITTSTYSPAHRGPQSHRPREEASQTPPALEPLQARQRRERGGGGRERGERGGERERRERGREREERGGGGGERERRERGREREEREGERERGERGGGERGGERERRERGDDSYIIMINSWDMVRVWHTTIMESSEL